MSQSEPDEFLLSSAQQTDGNYSDNDSLTQELVPTRTDYTNLVLADGSSVDDRVGLHLEGLSEIAVDVDCAALLVDHEQESKDGELCPQGLEQHPVTMQAESGDNSIKKLSQMNIEEMDCDHIAQLQMLLKSFQVADVSEQTTREKTQVDSSTVDRETCTSVPIEHDDAVGSGTCDELNLTTASVVTASSKELSSLARSQADDSLTSVMTTESAGQLDKQSLNSSTSLQVNEDQTSSTSPDVALRAENTDSQQVVENESLAAGTAEADTEGKLCSSREQSYGSPGDVRTPEEHPEVGRDDGTSPAGAEPPDVVSDYYELTHHQADANSSEDSLTQERLPPNDITAADCPNLAVLDASLEDDRVGLHRDEQSEITSVISCDERQPDIVQAESTGLGRLPGDSSIKTLSQLNIEDMDYDDLIQLQMFLKNFRVADDNEETAREKLSQQADSSAVDTATSASIPSENDGAIALTTNNLSTAASSSTVSSQQPNGLSCCPAETETDESKTLVTTVQPAGQFDDKPLTLASSLEVTDGQTSSTSLAEAVRTENTDSRQVVENELLAASRAEGRSAGQELSSEGVRAPERHQGEERDEGSSSASEGVSGGVSQCHQLTLLLRLRKEMATMQLEVARLQDAMRSASSVLQELTDNAFRQS